MNRRALFQNTVFLITLILLVLVFIVLFNQKTRQVGEVDLAIKTQRSLLEVNTAKLEYLNEIEKAKPQLTNALSVLKAQIPALPEENQLVSEMEQISKSAGTELVDLRFTGRTAVEDRVEIPFVITVRGSYSSFVGLLDGIEKGKRLVRIDQIQMTKEETKGIKAEVSAVAFSSVKE